MEIVLSIYSNILDDKIPYEKTALLEIQFSCTRSTPLMSVVISVDKKNIIVQPFSTEVTQLSHKVPEPHNNSVEPPQEHELCIEVRGEATGAMLHIHSIRIEGLCMRLTMEDSGTCELDGEPAVPSEYMGQVGYQRLKFMTPIYPWLLANERKDTYYYPH
jgi:hypothetical protein